MLIPRHKTPELSLPTVGGGTFDLDRDAGERGTLVVFYRGLHCPICAKQLTELEAHADAFAERGIAVVAVSCDGEERASQMAKKAGTAKVAVAHGLSLQAARDWGLMISAGRGKTSAGIEEPDLFCEPGLFLVNPDRTLYFEVVQSMPFTRPSAEALLTALDFAIEKNYPARGEYTGPVE